MVREEWDSTQSVEKWLSKAKLLEYDIKSCEAQLAMLNNQSNKKATERERKYLSRLVAHKQQARAEIRIAIDTLPDSVEKSILTMRYLEYASWEKIAERVGYQEERSVRRAARRAMGSIVIPRKDYSMDAGGTPK